jgi:hypothetical protein
MGTSLAGAKRFLLCTAEHLIAKSEGGTDTASNIAAACMFCNQARHKAKHPLSPEDYRNHVQRRIRRGRWHQGFGSIFGA